MLERTALGAEWALLLRHLSLLQVMTRRELGARYAGSAVGVLWAYAQPILLVAAYYLVFDVVFAMRMGANAPAERVGTYLIVGSLPWLAFCDGVSRGAASLVEAGGMMQKNALPPVLFVARTIFAGMWVFAPLLLLLAVLYIPVGEPGWSLVAFVLLVMVQQVLTFLLAYVLAILAAAVRDTLQVLAFVLQMGVFLSPVLFPMTLFPQDWRWVLYANPMTALVQGYQSILLLGQWPEGMLWAVMVAWVLLLALTLEWLLRSSKDQLVDWL